MEYESRALSAMKVEKEEFEKFFFNRFKAGTRAFESEIVLEEIGSEASSVSVKEAGEITRGIPKPFVKIAIL